MANKYDDIINLPHWDPQNHPRMPLANRAAQFAPFAALVGHDEAINETARLTDQLEALDSESAEILNEKVNLLLSLIHTRPEIQVCYFVADTKKSGGEYVTYKGRVRLLDETERLLTFEDGTEIPLSVVFDLKGEIFGDIDGRL